jgi:hypothetical protein
MRGPWLTANQSSGIRCTLYKHSTSVVMYLYDIKKKTEVNISTFLLGIKELNFGYKIVKPIRYVYWNFRFLIM